MNNLLKSLKQIDKMAVTNKIGVIGAGKMAGALVKGWVRSGVIQPEQVSC
jgi:hypothetical protein